MASGNTSGLGASLFRGALHGNTSNTNNLSGNNNAGNQQQQQQHQPHHHHHHHSTGHLPQQSGVQASSAHLNHPQQPQPSQSQPTLGAVTFTSEDNTRGRGTPGVTNNESPDHMSTVMAKLWFDHNVESSLSSLKKEEHEKRIRDLRKQLEYIVDTNWKYSPVEKYIGQQ